MDDKYLPICQAINQLLLKQARVVLGIDGHSGAGKSTLAQNLAGHYGAAVISMDHFYLPADLRTPERICSPGETIHWERMLSEVAPHLRAGKAFSYQVFDCGAMCYTHSVQIHAAPLVIVEGCYALHPNLADVYNLRVFLCCSPAVQRERILKRNITNATQFFERWIPLENAYFKRYGMPNQDHMVINTEFVTELVER